MSKQTQDLERIYRIYHHETNKYHCTNNNENGIWRTKQGSYREKERIDEFGEKGYEVREYQLIEYREE